MSRKHFIALADALRAERPQVNWSTNKHIQWGLDVIAVSNALAKLSPRFDKIKWLLYVEQGKDEPLLAGKILNYVGKEGE